jgi:hypothetical protein
MDKVDTKIAHLKTQHGFDFEVEIFNKNDWTHFGGSEWGRLCKAYGFQEEMKITFDLGNLELADVNIWLDPNMIPILPPCEFIKQIC